MRLISIKLRNFKRFADFQAEFGPGVNVVKGLSNEIGKSTLLEGIIAALFHNPRSSGAKTDEYISWGATKRYQTSLEFEERQERYLTEKDFEKRTARLVGYDTGEDLDVFKRISERMGELLGATSQSLFSSTACIRQDEVSQISSGEKEIRDSLEKVVTGGEENVVASQVIKKLDDRLSDIKRGLGGTAKFPGRLKSLQNQIEGLLQRRSDVGKEVSEVEAKKVELARIGEELARVREEHENSRALLERNRQRQEIEASVQKLTRSYDEADRLLGEIGGLAAASRRASEALKAIEGMENRAHVSEVREELHKIQIRRADIEGDLSEREKEIAEARQKLEKRKAVNFFGSKQFTVFSAIMVVAGIGLVLLAVAMWARSVLAREKTQIADLEQRILNMRKSLESLQKEERAHLAEVRCGTVAEFEARERDFANCLAERDRAEQRLTGMLRGRTIEEIGGQRQELARNLAVEQAKLTEDLKATALNPEEYVALEARVAALDRRQAELENSRRDCEAAIKWARFDAEHQVELEEELESLQESLKREEYRVRVYEVAREFIAKARSEVFVSATETLEREIQKNLAVFTDGRYERVKVNRENLEFQIYSEEKGDWVTVTSKELSGGVIDEFYLASRLALVRLIFGDRKPPLLLDDPFSNFDAVRLSRALDFFKKLAEEYQIIIFTLKDSYDKIADKVIRLY